MYPVVLARNSSEKPSGAGNQQERPRLEAGNLMLEAGEEA